MYNYLIYNQLKEHIKADKAFHMPGHKAKGDFKSKFPVAQMDVTELSYTDNLLCPTGVIVKVQEEIAEIIGAKRSYILTDGSSSGVLAMLFAASKFGAKIIVPRSSHQSVWNACKIFNIEPVIVEGGKNEGLELPPDPALIARLVESDKTISGMIVTSPDYYGNIAPLKEYSEILKRHKRLLIVDGAHGAHLAFGGDIRKYAGVYADMWVDGAHKTLPVLTQGAILSLNDLSLTTYVEEGLTTFRTTSPSFPIMASVEYGVKFVKNNLAALEDLKAAVAAFRAKCPLKLYPSQDWAKIAADCEPLRVCSDDVAAFLEKKGIYAELSDGRYLLFYLSPMTAAADLNKLLSALNVVAGNKKLKKSYVPKPVLPPVEHTFSFLYALKQRRELIPLRAAAGRMCARNAGIAPPCTPVLVAGEIISDAAIAALSGAKNTFGLENGMIWVVAK